MHKGALFVHFCVILRKCGLFCRPLRQNNCTETHNKTQKHAKYTKTHHLAQTHAKPPLILPLLNIGVRPNKGAMDALQRNHFRTEGCHNVGPPPPHPCRSDSGATVAVWTCIEQSCVQRSAGCSGYRQELSSAVDVARIRAPDSGSAEDFFRFAPVSPFSSDLFRFAVLVFGNTPICSDLLRLFQNKSEQIRETLFCRPLLQFPDRVRAYSETITQPKEEVFGRQPCRHPAKNFGQALQILEKTSILARRCCADVHERTSVRKTSG